MQTCKAKSYSFFILVVFLTDKDREYVNKQNSFKDKVWIFTKPVALVHMQDRFRCESVNVK